MRRPQGQCSSRNRQSNHRAAPCQCPGASLQNLLVIVALALTVGVIDYTAFFCCCEYS
jgi:hypothetical protein